MRTAAHTVAEAIEAVEQQAAEEAEINGAGASVLALDEILTHEGNLCDLLDDNVIAGIGSRTIADKDIDEASRDEWLKRYHLWLDMAMQVRKEKNFPWPKAANYKFPLLTTASIQFQARAYPAIVDGANLVKGRVLSADPEGTKRDRADRIGQHMSWQLLHRMPDWEEETDRLLLMLPIVGSVFRKTYYDSLLGTNVSDVVTAQDFIINYWAKSLETTPRYTHRLRFYRHEVLAKERSGLWLEVAFEPEEGNGDEDGLAEYFEQHRYEDLDDDGVPEPYVVTVNASGRVVRIVPCFGPEDVMQGDQGVIRIQRRAYFTKYGFIPAPDGSFYDIGFGWLLEDISSGIDGALNRMMDAGALQNAGGGFISSAVQHRGGNLPTRIGEWKRIEVTGSANLRDSIFPFPQHGPSIVLFNLLQLLIGAAKEITSVQEIMTGAAPVANTPATTTLAQIEQAQKVMSGILKRVHRSFGKDLKILRRLNRDYLDEEEYFALLDEDEPSKIGRADYDDADLDVMPVSDPTVASDAQKLARAQALFALKGDPKINQDEINRRYLDAIGERDVKALLEVEPAGPDPRVLLEMMKEARAKQESAAKVRAQDAASAAKLYESAEKAFLLGDLPRVAILLDAVEELIGGIDDAGAEPAAGPGGVPAMAGQPDDAGLSALPVGPPGLPDAGMGQGDFDDPGGAGPGGAVGPVGGDQV